LSNFYPRFRPNDNLAHDWSRAAGLGIVLGRASCNLTVTDVDDLGLSEWLMRQLTARPRPPLMVRTAHGRLQIYVAEPAPSRPVDLVVRYQNRRCLVQLLAPGCQAAAPPAPATRGSMRTPSRCTARWPTYGGPSRWSMASRTRTPGPIPSAIERGRPGQRHRRFGIASANDRRGSGVPRGAGVRPAELNDWPTCNGRTFQPPCRCSGHHRRLLLGWTFCLDPQLPRRLLQDQGTCWPEAEERE